MAQGMERRQVFDLPERLIEVTEHQALNYVCAGCGGSTRAPFPEGVASPAQYGERLRAATVYLNVQQLIPEDRAAHRERPVRRAEPVSGQPCAMDAQTGESLRAGRG